MQARNRCHRVHHETLSKKPTLKHRVSLNGTAEIPDCEPGDERLGELARSIADALTVHAKVEEEFFYPELRDRVDDEEQLTDVFEAYTEHDVLKHLLALIKSEKGPDEKFKAELQVLGESVKHHVKEEESTIFKLARKFMSHDELQSCGSEMADKKRVSNPQLRRGHEDSAGRLTLAVRTGLRFAL